MKVLAAAPSMVQQVHDALLGEIAAGRLAPGDRLVQESVAKALGVSRQPVQQALVLLRNQGLLRDAPGRGLIVAPLDPTHVRHVYEVRTAIEALAARGAATHGAERAARQGAPLIEAGRRAVQSGSVPRMFAADVRFHEFLYELSGNPLIGAVMATHLTYTQRVMGEVLTHDEWPHDVWDQHEAILEAVAAGDADRAERLAREHVAGAADYLLRRLASGGDAPLQPITAASA
jgi:DNA-binding GntR family transcriptional regulator